MQHKQSTEYGCSSVVLPTAARFSQGSKKLTEKLARQIQWMQERGINIQLKDGERPAATHKSPLPGTVLYFSTES